jgi:hypothetical protein
MFVALRVWKVNYDFDACGLDFFQMKERLPGRKNVVKNE